MSEVEIRDRLGPSKADLRAQADAAVREYRRPRISKNGLGWWDVIDWTGRVLFSAHDEATAKGWVTDRISKLREAIEDGECASLGLSPGDARWELARLEGHPD